MDNLNRLFDQHVEVRFEPDLTRVGYTALVFERVETSRPTKVWLNYDNADQDADYGVVPKQTVVGASNLLQSNDLRWLSYS